MTYASPPFAGFAALACVVGGSSERHLRLAGGLYDERDGEQKIRAIG